MVVDLASLGISTSQNIFAFLFIAILGAFSYILDSNPFFIFSTHPGSSPYPAPGLYQIGKGGLW